MSYIFVTLSIIPTFNIIFNLFIRSTFCSPREDLLTGLGGVCEIMSMGNLIMYITGTRFYLHIFGLIMLSLGIIFMHKTEIISFSKYRLRTILLYSMFIPYLLYFGLWRIIIGFLN